MPWSGERCVSLKWRDQMKPNITHLLTFSPLLAQSLLQHRQTHRVMLKDTVQSETWWACQYQVLSWDIRPLKRHKALRQMKNWVSKQCPSRHIYKHTVHSESTPTPWHFTHFVTLQAYYKIDYIVFFPTSIYTQYPLKSKKRFLEMFANVKNIGVRIYHCVLGDLQCCRNCFGTFS